MNRPATSSPTPPGPPTPPVSLPEPSTQPSVGWHCTHVFYKFNRWILSQFGAQQRSAGVAEISEILTPGSSDAPIRLQTMIVSGHKADFGLIALDENPLKIDRVHHRLLSSNIGAALEATYSFVSLTEVSEYVPSPSQYAQRLMSEGEQADSPQLLAKVTAYEKRLPAMNAQRLTPELPNWPAICFYPMNKSRGVEANWFTTPFSQRNAMMAEHAQSGMSFAGRVTQLVTVSVGLDDWEWGVTLWARRPDYLKEIVYKMRFDEASAKYGQFGHFYVGYLAHFDEIAQHCNIQ